MREEQRIATKTKILQTAETLLKEKGLEAVTIRDICESAEISIGTFYYHFPTKQHLIQESFLLYDEKLRLQLNSYDDKNPIASLKGVLIDQIKYVTSQPVNLVTEYYKSILGAEGKKAVFLEREYYKAVYHYVALAFAQNIFMPAYSKKQISEFFIKQVRGNIIDWCLHNAKIEIDKQSIFEIDVMIKAVSRTNQS